MSRRGAGRSGGASCGIREFRRRFASLRLNVGRPDHPAPFRGVVCDELAKGSTDSSTSGPGNAMLIAMRRASSFVSRASISSTSGSASPGAPADGAVWKEACKDETSSRVVRGGSWIGIQGEVEGFAVN